MEEECQRGCGRESVLENLCGEDSAKKRECVDDRKVCAPLDRKVCVSLTTHKNTIVSKRMWERERLRESVWGRQYEKERVCRRPKGLCSA